MKYNTLCPVPVSFFRWGQGNKVKHKSWGKRLWRNWPFHESPSSTQILSGGYTFSNTFSKCVGKKKLGEKYFFKS